MSEQDISRREVLKKGSFGLGAAGAITTLGAGTTAASSHDTKLRVSAYGSGASTYKIRIDNAKNAIYGGGNNDNIYNYGDNGVIDGKVYSGHSDSYTIYQDYTDSYNMDIELVNVDGNIKVTQNKGTETPLNGSNDFKFEGDGNYRLETNYGNCQCGDKKFLPVYKSLRKYTCVQLGTRKW